MLPDVEEEDFSEALAIPVGRVLIGSTEGWRRWLMARKQEGEL